MLLIALMACRDKGGESDTAGIADACPALVVAPTQLDFGQVALAVTHSAEVTVTNLCVGSADLEAVAAWGGGSSAFGGDLGLPTLAPGESHVLTVEFSPEDFDLHSSSIQFASVDQSAAVEVSGQAARDADGDGFDSVPAGGEDCDDTDASVNPDATDSWYDGVDSDCDGAGDYDQDGDGEDHQDYGGNDCDDEDPAIPADEVWYDGVDSDCDGLSDFDQDGDGVDSSEYGGTDCDDTDPEVYPGAPEVWYDGIDQDCGEDTDYDQDGDGEESSDYGGTDCDDTDPAIFYDSGELTQDTLDDDCDGLVDEDFITRGDILVVEVMMAPAIVGDTYGEWFEVLNTTSVDIDLVGWDLTSWGNTGTTIGDSLVVPAGGTVVIGAEDDTALNGDLAVDYEYDRSLLAFSDGADNVFLYLGETWIARAAWDGTDDWTLVDGASAQLDSDYLTLAGQADGAYWCPSVTVFGDGDYGTPNDSNEVCTSNDYDGDGYSRDDGDCDEGDSSVYPGADEAWDEVDNDCDGAVDNLVVDEVATAYLTGSSGLYLTYQHSLGLGDHDGDGTLDIVAGSMFLAGGYAYGGGVYVVDGAPYTGYAGPISQNEYATVYDYYYNYSGTVDPDPGDVDGDGVDDLFVVGTDYVGYGVAGALFFGGNLSGSLSMYGGDADITFTDTYGAAGVQRVKSSLDIDGDGGDDLLFTDWDYYYYSTTDNGWAYLYLASGLSSGSNYDLQDDADLVWSGADALDYLGHSVGGGDIDGDGYDDVLLGAPGADQGQTNSGSVYLIYGSSTGGTTGTADAAASLTLYGEAGDDYLGWMGSPQVGDFDNDGTQDLAVANSTQSVYVFYGASSLSGKVRVDTADVIITSTGPDYFGFSLDSGDLDADGTDDLVIGAPDYGSYYYATSYADEPGAVYWFNGGDMTASMSHLDANASFTGTATADLLGLSVAVGDLSGDGTDDLLVGAPRYGSTYGVVWIVESP